MIVALAAWVLVLWETKTVVITGPILLLLSVPVAILGRRLRHRAAIVLAAAQAFICLLFIGLVNILSWGPEHAHLPFSIMGAFYVLLSTPLAIRVLWTIPIHHDPTRCRGCGYLLYGLPEPRCPECGTPFDPTTVSHDPRTFR